MIKIVSQKSMEKTRSLAFLRYKDCLNNAYCRVTESLMTLF
jgi:hypothetical protein